MHRTLLAVITAAVAAAACGGAPARVEEPARDSTAIATVDGSLASLIGFLPDDVSTAAVVRPLPADRGATTLPLWTGEIVAARFEGILPVSQVRAAREALAGTSWVLFANSTDAQPLGAVVFEVAERHCTIVRFARRPDFTRGTFAMLSVAPAQYGFAYHVPSEELLREGLREGPVGSRMVGSVPAVLELDDRTLAFVEPAAAPIVAERIANRSPTGSPRSRALHTALAAARGGVTAVAIEPDERLSRATLDVVPLPPAAERIQQVGLDLTLVPRAGRGSELVHQVSTALGAGHVQVRDDRILAGLRIETPERYRTER